MADDYLTILARRAIGELPLAQPRVLPRFAESPDRVDAPGEAWELPSRTERLPFLEDLRGGRQASPQASGDDEADDDDSDPGDAGPSASQPSPADNELTLTVEGAALDHRLPTAQTSERTSERGIAGSEAASTPTSTAPSTSVQRSPTASPEPTGEPGRAPAPKPPSPIDLLPTEATEQPFDAPSPIQRSVAEPTSVQRSPAEPADPTAGPASGSGPKPPSPIDLLPTEATEQPFDAATPIRRSPAPAEADRAPTTSSVPTAAPSSAVQREAAQREPVAAPESQTGRVATETPGRQDAGGPSSRSASPAPTVTSDETLSSRPPVSVSDESVITTEEPRLDPQQPPLQRLAETSIDGSPKVEDATADWIDATSRLDAERSPSPEASPSAAETTSTASTSPSAAPVQRQALSAEAPTSTEPPSTAQREPVAAPENQAGRGDTETPGRQDAGGPSSRSASPAPTVTSDETLSSRPPVSVSDESVITTEEPRLDPQQPPLQRLAETSIDGSPKVEDATADWIDATSRLDAERSPSPEASPSAAETTSTASTSPSAAPVQRQALSAEAPTSTEPPSTAQREPVAAPENQAGRGDTETPGRQDAGGPSSRSASPAPTVTSDETLSSRPPVSVSDESVITTEEPRLDPQQPPLQRLAETSIDGSPKVEDATADWIDATSRLDAERSTSTEASPRTAETTSTASASPSTTPVQRQALSAEAPASAEPPSTALREPVAAPESQTGRVDAETPGRQDAGGPSSRSASPEQTVTSDEALSSRPPVSGSDESVITTEGPRLDPQQPPLQRLAETSIDGSPKVEDAPADWIDATSRLDAERSMSPDASPRAVETTSAASTSPSTPPVQRQTVSAESPISTEPPSNAQREPVAAPESQTGRVDTETPGRQDAGGPSSRTSPTPTVTSDEGLSSRPPVSGSDESVITTEERRLDPQQLPLQRLAETSIDGSPKVEDATADWIDATSRLDAERATSPEASPSAAETTSTASTSPSATPVQRQTVSAESPISTEPPSTAQREPVAAPESQTGRVDTETPGRQDAGGPSSRTSPTPTVTSDEGLSSRPPVSGSDESVITTEERRLDPQQPPLQRLAETPIEPTSVDGSANVEETQADWIDATSRLDAERSTSAEASPGAAETTNAASTSSSATPVQRQTPTSEAPTSPTSTEPPSAVQREPVAAPESQTGRVDDATPGRQDAGGPSSSASPTPTVTSDEALSSRPTASVSDDAVFEKDEPAPAQLPVQRLAETGIEPTSNDVTANAEETPIDWIDATRRLDAERATSPEASPRTAETTSAASTSASATPVQRQTPTSDAPTSTEPPSAVQREPVAAPESQTGRVDDATPGRQDAGGPSRSASPAPTVTSDEALSSRPPVSDSDESVITTEERRLDPQQPPLQRLAETPSEPTSVDGSANVEDATADWIDATSRLDAERSTSTEASPRTAETTSAASTSASATPVQRQTPTSDAPTSTEPPSAVQREPVTAPESQTGRVDDATPGRQDAGGPSRSASPTPTVTSDEALSSRPTTSVSDDAVFEKDEPAPAQLPVQRLAETGIEPTSNDVTANAEETPIDWIDATRRLDAERATSPEASPRTAETTSVASTRPSATPVQRQTPTPEVSTSTEPPSTAQREPIAAPESQTGRVDDATPGRQDAGGPSRSASPAPTVTSDEALSSRPPVSDSDESVITTEERRLDPQQPPLQRLAETSIEPTSVDGSANVEETQADWIDATSRLDAERSTSTEASPRTVETTSAASTSPSATPVQRQTPTSEAPASAEPPSTTQREPVAAPESQARRVGTETPGRQDAGGPSSSASPAPTVTSDEALSSRPTASVSDDSTFEKDEPALAQLPVQRLAETSIDSSANVEETQADWIDATSRLDAERSTSTEASPSAASTSPSATPVQRQALSAEAPTSTESPSTAQREPVAAPENQTGRVDTETSGRQDAGGPSSSASPEQTVTSDEALSSRPTASVSDDSTFEKDEPALAQLPVQRLAETSIDSSANVEETQADWIDATSRLDAERSTSTEASPSAASTSPSATPVQRQALSAEAPTSTESPSTAQREPVAAPESQARRVGTETPGRQDAGGPSSNSASPAPTVTSDEALSSRPPVSVSDESVITTEGPRLDPQQPPLQHLAETSIEPTSVDGSANVEETPADWIDATSRLDAERSTSTEASPSAASTSPSATPVQRQALSAEAPTSTESPSTAQREPVTAPESQTGRVDDATPGRQDTGGPSSSASPTPTVTLDEGLSSRPPVSDSRDAVFETDQLAPAQLPVQRLAEAGIEPTSNDVTANAEETPIDRIDATARLDAERDTVRTATPTVATGATNAASTRAPATPSAETSASTEAPSTTQREPVAAPESQARPVDTETPGRQDAGGPSSSASPAPTVTLDEGLSSRPPVSDSDDSILTTDGSRLDPQQPPVPRMVEPSVESTPNAQPSIDITAEVERAPAAWIDATSRLDAERDNARPTTPTVATEAANVASPNAPTPTIQRQIDGESPITMDPPSVADMASTSPATDSVAEELSLDPSAAVQRLAEMPSIEAAPPEAEPPVDVSAEVERAPAAWIDATSRLDAERDNARPTTPAVTSDSTNAEATHGSTTTDQRQDRVESTVTGEPPSATEPPAATESSSASEPPPASEPPSATEPPTIDISAQVEQPAPAWIDATSRLDAERDNARPAAPTASADTTSTESIGSAVDPAQRLAPAEPTPSTAGDVPAARPAAPTASILAETMARTEATMGDSPTLPTTVSRRSRPAVTATTGSTTSPIVQRSSLASAPPPTPSSTPPAPTSPTTTPTLPTRSTSPISSMETPRSDRVTESPMPSSARRGVETSTGEPAPPIDRRRGERAEWPDLPAPPELPEAIADQLDDVFAGLYPGEEAARTEDELRRAFAHDDSFRTPPKRRRDAEQHAEAGPTIRVRIGHLQIVEPEPPSQPTRPRRRAPSRLADFLGHRKIRR